MRSTATEGEHATQSLQSPQLWPLTIHPARLLCVVQLRRAQNNFEGDDNVEPFIYLLPTHEGYKQKALHSNSHYIGKLWELPPSGWRPTDTFTPADNGDEVHFSFVLFTTSSKQKIENGRANWSEFSSVVFGSSSFTSNHLTSNLYHSRIWLQLIAGITFYLFKFSKGVCVAGRE